jgi:hypothetical protein
VSKLIETNKQDEPEVNLNAGGKHLKKTEMVATETFDLHRARQFCNFLVPVPSPSMSQIFNQQRGGGGNLFLGGSKISDQDVRDQNGIPLPLNPSLTFKQSWQHNP